VGQAFSVASDINEFGVVVGSSSHPVEDPSEDHGPHAFRATPGSAMVDLGTSALDDLGTAAWFSHATAANPRGQIVGNSTAVTEYGYAGVFWDRSNTLSTITRSGSGTTTDINKRGKVVGIEASGDSPPINCTFVWSQDAGKRCLPQLPGGGALLEPPDINDRGQIVGTGLTAQGAAHAVLWEPVRRGRGHRLG
jgi:probable HAF family extracellular repeat protein